MRLARRFMRRLIDLLVLTSFSNHECMRVPLKCSNASGSLKMLIQDAGNHARTCSRATGVPISGRSAYRPSKRRTLPQIFHQVLHVAQISAQQRLLVFRRSCVLLRTCIPTCTCRAAAKGSGELAWAARQHSSSRSTDAGDGWRLGHEIKVQEFNQLELNLSTGRALLEEGGDGQQAIKRLKGTCVSRLVEERADESEEGRRLNGRAI